MTKLIDCRYPGCKSKVEPSHHQRYVVCFDHDDVDTDRYEYRDWSCNGCTMLFRADGSDDDWVRVRGHLKDCEDHS